MKFVLWATVGLLVLAAAAFRRSVARRAYANGDAAGAGRPRRRSCAYN